MPSNPTGLRVVDFYGSFGTNLKALDIEKVDVVGGCVNGCPEKHGVGALAVEELCFVEWKGAHFRA